MPGGRLTDEDRQQIASGLGEGLGYAEIARRLGRPTSTVSREVDRNGGTRGYRADHAQQATRRRARRRGPTGPAHAVDAYGRDAGGVRRAVRRSDGPRWTLADGRACAGRPGHDRLRCVDRQRAGPAPAGEPGLDLQGDRVPGTGGHGSSRARPGAPAPALCDRRGRLAEGVEMERSDQLQLGRDRGRGCRPGRARHPGRRAADADGRVLPPPRRPGARRSSSR